MGNCAPGPATPPINDFSWVSEDTPEARAKRKAAAEKRYAHLMNKPRDWLADPSKNRPGAK